MYTKDLAIKEAIGIVSPKWLEVLSKFQRNNKTKDFSPDNLIKILSSSSYNLAHALDISAATTSKFLKEFIPNRTNINQKPCTYLLGEVGLKFCSRCEEVRLHEDFRKNAHQRDGLNTLCKYCHLETTSSTQTGRQAKYRCAKLNRTPVWSETELIKTFYDACAKGFHVDHIIPLQGDLVSGLHVLSNLQYLLGTENCSKSNNFIVE